MGVRLLKSFVEQHCPDAFYIVNIEDLANEYRKKHGRDPVIVVDGMSCIRKLYSNLDWVCGGQHNEFSENIDRFLKKFKELNIELVFFFDGATQTRKRSVWVQRRYNTMKDAFSVFEDLRKGKHVAEIDEKLFLLPCGMSYVLTTMAKEHCKVFRSVKECDEEIVEYAVKNKCFAILGQDSDFIIFKQEAIYLSIDTINLDSMTTHCYDRRALARHLNLSEDELSILATLMGNDVVEFHHLKRFHHRITGKVVNQPYPSVLVHKLAAYIRDWNQSRDILEFLPELSKEIFGIRNQASLLKESIFSYSVSTTQSDETINMIDVAQSFDTNWDRIMWIAKKNYIDMTSSSHLYSILQGLPFEMSTALENYKTVPPSAQVLKCMRQRIYGIALRENPELSRRGHPNIVVEEWCMSGPNSLGWAEKVTAICPPDHFPSLLDLWTQDTEHINSEKLNVLGWITSPSISVSLHSLPVEVLAPACILSYLYNDVKILYDWEVEVFASLVVDVQAMNSHDLSRVQVSVVNIRGLHLAVLFTRSLVNLRLANSVCGDPIPRHWVKFTSFFDGKLFQAKYLQEERVPQKGTQKNFELLCSAVLTGEKLA